MRWIKDHALYLAWLVTLSGLLLSIFYAEVLNLEPCRLCWYQRIAIFPLALFLGIAAYREERRLAIYCLPLVIFGGLAAFYQLLSDLFPKMHSEFLCGMHSCTLASIPPMLSLSGFVAMAVLIFIAD